MAKTTQVLHLGHNIFLVPVKPRDHFFDLRKNGAGAFFNVISIPPSNIPLLVLGYGGEFDLLTAAETKGCQYATITHPLRNTTTRAVLHVALRRDPATNGIFVRGRHNEYIVSTMPRAGATAPIFEQFSYFAGTASQAIFAFFEDQPDLLTLPGAI